MFFEVRSCRRYFCCLVFGFLIAFVCHVSQKSVSGNPYSSLRNLPLQRAMREQMHHFKFFQLSLVFLDNRGISRHSSGSSGSLELDELDTEESQRCWRLSTTPLTPLIRSPNATSFSKNATFAPAALISRVSCAQAPASLTAVSGSSRYRIK